MTQTYPWAKTENYAYLKELDAKHRAKGWAWEFIRRSEAYRAMYDSFAPLQKQHGADWRKKQAFDIHEPALLPGESVSAWRSRALDIVVIARKVSASQVAARKWLLHDLYDPALPYDKKIIRFEVLKRYPEFYCSESVAKDTYINDIEDLQHDLVHWPISNVLYVALDVTQPWKYQRAKLEKTFNLCKKSQPVKQKGQPLHWMTYIQFLDALDSGINLPLTQIMKAIKPPAWSIANLPMAASECKEAALKMANDGYKGLLRQIQNS